MSDSVPYTLNKAISIAHAVNQLKLERENFKLRLSEQQSRDLDWIVQTFPPDSSFVVDQAKWKNNYSKAILAADAAISCIPHLRDKLQAKVGLDTLASALTTPMPETSASSIDNLEPSFNIERPNTMDKRSGTSDIKTYNTLQNQAGPSSDSITMSNEQFRMLINSFAQKSQSSQPTFLSQPLNNSHAHQVNFRPHDIGFFEPNDMATEAVEFKDGKTIYHNVYSFTARIKSKICNDRTSVWSSANVAQMLDQCLKGKAELWYTNELDDLARAGLKTGHKLWCSTLESRFRMPPGEALRELYSLKYGIDEDRARVNPEDFVQKVILYGNSSGTAVTVYAQLLLAHTLLDGRLRLNVPEPTESTSITTFIQALTSIKATWFDIWPPQQRMITRSTRHVYNEGQSQSRPLPSGYHPRRPLYAKDHNGEQNHKSKQLEFQNDSRNASKYPTKEKFPRRYGKAYAAEPESSKESQNNDHHESDSVDDDPYDDSYFQGIDVDNIDRDENESETINHYKCVESFPVNLTYHKNLPNVEKPRPRNLTCQICNSKFTSGNKLHFHLNQKHSKKYSSSHRHHVSSTFNTTTQNQSSVQILTQSLQDNNNKKELASDLTVVTSTAPKTTNSPGYAFRGRRYAQLQVSIASPHNEQVPVCLDTGCTMSLIDRKLLQQHNPTAIIHRTKTDTKVRGLGNTLYDASDFTEVDFYIRSKNNVVAHFQREIHIVEDLPANALIGIDIATVEGWLIDLDAEKLTMPKNYGISVNISTQCRAKIEPIQVFAKEKSIIKPHCRAMITISTSKGEQLELPCRDIVFEPSALDALTTFPSLVTDGCSGIIVQNDANIPVTISKYTHLGKIVDSDCDKGDITVNEINVYHLIAQPPMKSSKQRLVCKGLLSSAAAGNLSSSPKIFKCDVTDDDTEHREYLLSNGVTIFGNEQQHCQLQNLISKYKVIWEDQKCFAKTPTGEEMTINLIPDWQSKYKAGQARVYTAGSEDRKVIDKTFDELHKQGRLHWTNTSTPFSFPCFVIWKNITKEDGSCDKKGRVVIDIRALNHITLPDAYPIPTQADIIAAVAGCNFISTIDCASFFYQWKVQKDHQHKFTVSSHRGQETFNCAVMGFRNSPAYVQRIIDTILRDERYFARAYIDDIVIFSHTFQDHLNHLKAVFQKLKDHFIHLSPKKCFLSYPSVALLGQRVDALGLSSATDKLDAIKNLQFPYTLKQLEYYLGLTSWLRQYILGYAQRAAPLQARKIKLTAELKAANITGSKRQREATKMKILDITTEELQAFKSLQTAFESPAILVHFDPNKRLYADLDASKKGMGAMVYHSDKDPPTQKSVKPIMFLSRLIKKNEMNYWPTELEVACCCWVISKIRHMIETTKLPTIIYTDHSATVQIATQTSMTTTTSLVRLNQRHQRSSQYLSTFRLEIRHKPGKHNIVPDALSRLEQNKSSDAKNSGQAAVV